MNYCESLPSAVCLSHIGRALLLQLLVSLISPHICFFFFEVVEHVRFAFPPFVGIGLQIRKILANHGCLIHIRLVIISK